MSALHLEATGQGSRAEIVDYVREVLEQCTTVNDDTTPHRLADLVVTSILNRLGAGPLVASGLEERVRAIEEGTADLRSRIADLEARRGAHRG